MERSGRFNLTDADEDNDTLTHYGQSIGEMNEFDYAGLSDEENDEGENTLLGFVLWKVG